MAVLNTAPDRRHCEPMTQTPRPSPDADGPTVGLFVTCLVDLFRPSVGFAAVRLLEAAGCRVVVPDAQTCCGQPAYNAGDRADARAIARTVIETFAALDHVVVPAGSCAGMLVRHYPRLFDDAPDWHARAQALADKTHELTSFLADRLGVTATGGRFPATVTCHDSCSGLRELGIKDAPRRLLAHVDGVALAEMDEAETCCGFGGLFCVKYDAVSAHMGAQKLDAAEAAGADVLVAGDMGCLLHLAGLARRTGRAIAVRHVAEVLAGDADTPAIGEGPDRP